nr:hypothetical protein [Bremerella cremea]
MRRITIAICLFCLTILSASGCTSLGKMPKMPWENDEPEYKLPIKMVVNWKDTIRYNPNDPAVRGFGGRVHFYDESNRPVRVEGQLTVYGYDDSRPGEADPERPDRKFIFEADKLQTHYSMSKLGHSYSFWVPWDRVGGDQKEITLAPFFRTSAGQVLMGEQTTQALPGIVKRPNQDLQQNWSPSPSDQLPPDVAQVTYQRKSYTPAGLQNEPSENQSKLRTTTITLPTSVQDSLRNSALPTQSPRTSSTKANVPAVQQPANTFERYPRPLMEQQQAINNAGPFKSRAPQSMQLKPGINMQSFRPDFTSSAKYSDYLSNGSSLPSRQSLTIAPGSVPGQQPGYQPQTHQAQVTQTGQRVQNHLQMPQTPSPWPHGLPQSRSR